jgi:serine/threonine protein kinase
VALKFLPRQLTADNEARERFEREAQAAAALNHPNIVTIHEIGEHEGQIYIAMEYVEGQTLKELISVHRTPSTVNQSPIAPSPLPLAQVIAIATQIASGLAAAHAKGIIHRDIKPQNILVDKDGRVKILDFGLAKLKGLTQLTKTGTTLGTVAYMSPEQALGKEVDQRSDIWSLGVILYEMLANKLPFPGEYDQAVIYSILNEKQEPLPQSQAALAEVVARALEKEPHKRYQHIGEMSAELEAMKKGRGGGFLKPWRWFRRPRVAVPALTLLLLSCFFVLHVVNRNAKIRRAEKELLPEIGQLITNSGYENYRNAFKLAEEAEKYIPHDPRLAEIFSLISVISSIQTEPEGAMIYLKNYKNPESEWEYAGLSPIEHLRLPVGFIRLKIEKEGYETIWAAATTFGFDLSKKNFFIPCQIVRRLDKKGSFPPGMVRITGATIQGSGAIGDFFIDRHEVTNRQFKEFVDKGGYQKKEYWKQKFSKNGKELAWEEVLPGFVDQTGRPGPATWQAGDSPDGQAEFPAAGVSWFEAAAYAEFAHKSLPTSEHWGIASGEYTLLFNSKSFFSYFFPQSNFSGHGLAPVGSHPAITAYGVCDMGGNVREWCWNETANGRLIRGGAWDDAPYMLRNWTQLSPFDRSPRNGFRCALYPDPGKIPAATFQKVSIKESPDFYNQRSVSEEIFKIYKEQFAYDKSELNAHLEWRKETAKDWFQEKVTFDAAYENERVTAFLFLPRNSSPPFQTIIYFPGSAATMLRSSKDIETFYDFRLFPAFLKNGRAVLFPVYKGTFERGSDALTKIYIGDDSHQYTEFFVKVVKDFKRSIDYLETRPDIDCAKLAYLGFSWGGNCGTIIPAVEERLKASMLISGGMRGYALPEVNEINYITRVNIPTLMLNGRYDMSFPYETRVKPMFDLLGTPKKQKELKLYNTDHIVPQNEVIKEALIWLDRFLGPVQR